MSFRLTAADHARLSDEADRLGVDANELARQRTLKGRVVVQQTTELAPADRAELNRLGVNLNQMVRHLNEHGDGALAPLADEARATLARINAALMRGGPG